MLNEIRDLGFSTIELSHGIRISLIEGMMRAFEKDPSLKICSLHNFCPLPVGYMRSAPNIYLLSSDHPSERQRAIRQTIHTMDFAVKMKARYVVLHLGSVSMGDYTRDLVSLIQDGKRDTPKYQKLLAKAAAKREDRGHKPFQRTMNSLEALVKEAADRNLVLGIENRYKLEEIPSEQEFVQIFKHFDTPHVGYWHDTGHAETWHHLGIADHEAWLTKFQDRIVGCHFHDVTYPDRDHQIPGKGTIAFQELAILKKPEVLKVFEFERSMKAEILKEQLPPFVSTFENSPL
jgi:sugar phosphate isomerase/epimerase